MQGKLDLFELNVENDVTIESIQSQISEKIGLSIDHFKLSYFNAANNKVLIIQIPLPPSCRLSLFELSELTEIYIDTVTDI